jgi:hypothetical protein
MTADPESSMRLVACVAALSSCIAILPGGVTAQERSAYVIRLGNDTVGLEQYTRTATRITGEYLVRAPRPAHALFTADLDATGALRRFELITHNIAGGPGPAETRSTVEITGDSAVVTVPRGDSSVTIRLGDARNAVLWGGYTVALYEHMARRAQAAGAATFTSPALTTGQLRGTATVTRGAGDTLLLSLSFPIGEVGPIRMTLDEAGLAYLSAVGTPTQIVAERVPFVDMDAAGPVIASQPLGTLSPRDTVIATLGTTEISVQYGRPLKRGRGIFGQVVPWSAVWRLGANAATHFHTSGDLRVGGADVPAGTYTLWALPSPAGWTLIINRQTGQWGTDYHAEQDLARVEMRVETLSRPVEQMTIAIEPEGAGAVLRVEWDRTRASVPIAAKQ